MNYTDDQMHFTKSSSSQDVVARTFMSNVFSFMAIALAITGIVAYAFGTNESLIRLLMGERGLSALGWIVMLAPFGLVLLMSAGFNRLSYGALTLVFGLFSVLMGMSLGFIFLIYTATSVFTTFIVTGGMFGTMALVGYTTKTDLTKFGSLMMMALVGLIIASIANWFAHSSTLQYIISFAGVIIFTGLTAYDVQKLKRIGEGSMYVGAAMNKLVILGALTLYMDFINLFLFLLRFLGNRK